MVRSTVSKIMWVGRATVFMVGLAVVLALVFGVATAALGAPVSTFKLGQINTSKAISTLVGAVSGSNLKIENTGTGANATALELKVPQGNAPLAVNTDAGKATNLNADKVDGQEASSFASQAGLNSEANTRANTDQTLQGNIDGESAARAAADNALGQGDGEANEPSDPVDFTKVKNIPADVINRNADTIDGKDSSELVGTAGQSAQTSFGTSSLDLSPSSSSRTLIPGLEQTVQVPDGGLLFVSTDGGLATLSTSAEGFSVVDVVLLVDGSEPSNAFFRRIVCANNGGRQQMICNWDFGGTLQLSPGQHTLQVVANNPGQGDAATVSGDNSLVLQGQLSIVQLNT
jgi:hypothetical protein